MTHFLKVIAWNSRDYFKHFLFQTQSCAFQDDQFLCMIYLFDLALDPTEGLRIQPEHQFNIKWLTVLFRMKKTQSINKNKVYPAGIYMFKVNNRSTRTRCDICSKLTIKTPERRQWRRSGLFIVNFEHISHLVLVLLLLTFSR